MADLKELKDQAEKLNVPTESGLYKPKNEAWGKLEVSEYELHRRIREEQRHRRENKLWILAVISALASVVSALTALCTVLTTK